MLTAGDVVQLKSGGPAMTVELIDGKRAYCIWFSGNRKEGSVFDVLSLQENRGEITLEELVADSGQ
jgi:uncharacterized protein YodC (DUF2158 family)